MLLMVAAMLCSSLYAGNRMVTGGFLLFWLFMAARSVEMVKMVNEVSQNLRDIARFEWWLPGLSLAVETEGCQEKRVRRCKLSHDILE